MSEWVLAEVVVNVNKENGEYGTGEIFCKFPAFNIVMLKELLFYVFFVVVLFLGLGCIVQPEKVLAFRKEKKLSNNLLSGGTFYSTKNRVRWTGFVLLIVATAALIFRQM